MPTTVTGQDPVADLLRAGVARRSSVGLAVAAGVGVSMSLGVGGPAVSVATDDPARVVAEVEARVGPRWVVWSVDTATWLVGRGVRLGVCWDLAVVHRLLAGGWQADPAQVWARLHDLDPEAMPVGGPPDLFSPVEEVGADEDPVGPGGYLRPDWAGGAWATSPARLERWAGLAVVAAARQHLLLGELQARPKALATARAESTAELLCAELSADGLPMDHRAAEQILAGYVGPRARTEADAAAGRASRDARVLAHAPPGVVVDLRSPTQVKVLLERLGVDVRDTRAWRLRALRDPHPLVPALLEWRKAERIATTYGYAWHDEHLDADGRLRGTWSGCDGAAGRMTASGGLHNMPAEMRAAVIAEPGQVFVRADLGQIEPRVLAAVSGDRALARASLADDMYAPVAAQLGVDRPTAKVAVLGAMYGQTTGRGAEALRSLTTAFPVAMAYLDDADRAGQAGRDLRTDGGRLIRLGADRDRPVDGALAAARAAARGRYARNALVQGAAAELFKLWAVTVRARGGPHGARIVLCLHDELLVQCPVGAAPAVARVLVESLAEAAHRWSPGGPVRFTADIGIVGRWSDAKA